MPCAYTSWMRFDLRLALVLACSCTFTTQGDNAVDAGAGLPLLSPDGAPAALGVDGGGNASVGTTVGGSDDVIYCHGEVDGITTCAAFMNLPAGATASELCQGGTQTASCGPGASGCCTGLVDPTSGVRAGFCVFGTNAKEDSLESSNCESSSGTWGAGNASLGGAPSGSSTDARPTLTASDSFGSEGTATTDTRSESSGLSGFGSSSSD